MTHNTLTVRPPIRVDPAGDGEYGTRRGDRTHKGVDLAMAEGSVILAPESGKMGAYGYAYPDPDDHSYRIVNLHGDSGVLYRFFYAVRLGTHSSGRVTAGDPIAMAQDITARYPDQDMLNHVHVETLRDGRNFDPREVLWLL